MKTARGQFYELLCTYKAAFIEAHPEADVISLGIGDVLEVLN